MEKELLLKKILGNFINYEKMWRNLVEGALEFKGTKGLENVLKNKDQLRIFIEAATDVITEALVLELKDHFTLPETEILYRIISVAIYEIEHRQEESWITSEGGKIFERFTEMYNNSYDDIWDRCNARIGEEFKQRKQAILSAQPA